MKIADLPYLVSYTLLNETFPENRKYYETLFSFLFSFNENNTWLYNNNNNTSTPDEKLHHHDFT